MMSCDDCPSGHGRIAGRLALAIMRGCFPFDEPAAQRRYSLRQLHGEYQSWRIASVVLILIGWPVCGVAVFFAFRGIARLWFAPRAEDVAVLPPPDYVWGIPAVFLGLLCCVLFLQGAYRLLLGERYEEYVVYEDWNSGYDSRQATPFVVYPFALLAIVGTALMFDWGTRITQHELIVNRYFGIGETHYPYADIVEVVELTRPCQKCGVKRERPCTVVFFKQGDSWKIDHLPDTVVNVTFVREIAQRAGRPIPKYDTLEDYQRRKKLKGKHFKPFG